MADIWVTNLAGEKALIADTDRDYWRMHGWSDTGEPGDDERVFVWMTNAETGHPAPIAWAARDYWMGRGFTPSPPETPVNPTKDPTLTASEQPPATPVPVDKPMKPAPAAPKNKEG